jgi:hypothetical protein
VATAVGLAVLLAPAVLAQMPGNPLNDLLALGEGSGQSPDKAPIQEPPVPSMDAVPRAHCGAGSKPEPDIQGRVPAGAATDGLWCNVSLLAHQGTSGGFKVLRYVDPAGHECAYYDTALLFPMNAVNLNARASASSSSTCPTPLTPSRLICSPRSPCSRRTSPSTSTRRAGCWRR